MPGSSVELKKGRDCDVTLNHVLKNEDRETHIEKGEINIYMCERDIIYLHRQ